MKTFYVTATVVFLFLYTNGIHAQTTQTKLNQVELMKQFVGTWQRDIGKDTIDGWEIQQYDRAIVSTGYLVIKGKKSFVFTEAMSLSPKEGKFHGYTLWSNGNYGTWIASFNSEKKWSGNWVRDFNPEAVTGKFEAVFETPTNMTLTLFNIDGVKTGKAKYSKVK